MLDNTRLDLILKGFLYSGLSVNGIMGLYKHFGIRLLVKLPRKTNVREVLMKLPHTKTRTHFQETRTLHFQKSHKTSVEISVDLSLMEDLINLSESLPRLLSRRSQYFTKKPLPVFFKGILRPLYFIRSAICSSLDAIYLLLMPK